MHSQLQMNWTDLSLLGVGHSFNAANDANSDDWRCVPVNITASGHGGKSEEHSTGDETVDALLGVLRKMFPNNVIKAAVDMNILGVIVFAVGFGVCLSGLGDKGEPFMNGIEIFNDVIMTMVTAALWFAPIGNKSLCPPCMLRSVVVSRRRFTDCCQPCWQL